MVIRWYGHSCFMVTSSRETSVLIDPYSETVKFNIPRLLPDIVLISHEHMDHNAAWRIDDAIIVKRTSSSYCEHEIPIRPTGETFVFRGIPTYHDEVLGKKRGPNTVFVWEMDNIKLCHLGDLGHVLDPYQKQSIGQVDILFIPTGGGSTIGPKEATVVIDQLNPRVIFPMHFASPAIDFHLESIDSFLALMANVEILKTNFYTLNYLPSKQKVIVLKYP